MAFVLEQGAIGYSWYDLRNDGINPADPEQNYGLLTNNLQPKPDYAAYMEAVLHRGDVVEWIELAQEEPWVIEQYEGAPGSR